MKVQGFQIWICWTIQILCFHLVICSSSSQMRVEKYTTSSYFESHGCLIDSDFDEFMRHELKIVPCQLWEDSPNVVLRLVDLNRNLIGEGSHRRLDTTVRFHLGLVPAHQLDTCSWEVIMIERLPSGVFADPFELQHFVQRGVFSDAAVFGDTNLELPSFRSNRSLIEVHKKIESIKTDKSEVEININLPLHARYQPLGHEFSKVILGQSDFFIRCSYKADMLNETCLISTDNYPSVEASTVAWEVPCGSKEHAKVVSAVTFLSAAVSAYLIVYTSIKFSTVEVSNHLKQS
ncbi:hypothetical protein LIER_33692 [Lithospermum erythrorhizon]|uniref:Phosphatidylinositol-glycan biosynthesis class X protein n=1 Tax=Lithospermum erythrorhizon TaxID=34254 RepID=A0AAV3RZN5_LITER